MIPARADRSVVVRAPWLLLAAAVAALAPARTRAQETPVPAQVSPAPGAPAAAAGAPRPASAPPPATAAPPAAPEQPPAPSPDASATDAAAQPDADTAAGAAPATTDTRVAAPGTSLFEGGLDAAAEPPPGSPADAAATSSAGNGDGTLVSPLGGYVRGDMFIGKVPGFSQGVVQAGYGELALKLDAREEGVGDAFAEARLRYGQQADARDLFIDLREAYVDAYLGPLDLRVGQQIIVWGRADAFNPTNNLTPFDLRIRSPIEDDRRLGNVGARAFYDLSPVRIEGVWLPLYRAAHYPPIELDEFVVMGEPDFPEPELGNGLGAARVHLELAAFEASVSYLHGHAPLPGLALRDFTAGVDPPEVRIARTAYPQHVVGFDASTAISDAIALRAEVAYRHPTHYQERVHAPRPDLQYVVGADRAFGPVSVIVQYLGRYVFDWEREDGPEDPIEPETLSRFMPPLPRTLSASITRSIEEELAARNQVLFQQLARVQHLASARVEWLALHDTLSLSALGLVNFTTEEWLLYPKIGYRLSDAMTTYVGAEVYVGPEGTLLDLIDQQLTAGYAELRFAF